MKNRQRELLYKDTILKWKLKYIEYKWCKYNTHNNIYIKCYSRMPLSVVSAGRYSYGTLHIHYYGNPQEHLELGSFCSIANDVHFILGGEHHPEMVFNYTLKRTLGLDENHSDDRCKGPIIIGDDVWIGSHSTILSGVSIEKGAIIAAGSIVTKNVPAYSVYIGNKVYKYRFEQSIIEELKTIDYDKLSLDKMGKKIDEIYKKVESNTIKDILLDCYE